MEDHIYWLLKVGLLKFQNYSPIQWHRRNLRFITFSHVLNFAPCTRQAFEKGVESVSFSGQIVRARKSFQEKDPSDAEAKKKLDSVMNDNLKMMLRPLFKTLRHFKAV